MAQVDFDDHPHMRLLPLGSAHDEIDAPATALGAHQPRVPIGDGHLRAVALGHLDRVGLDLVPAIGAPDDQPHISRSSVAERHRRAAVLHLWQSGEPATPNRQFVPFLFRQMMRLAVHQNTDHIVKRVVADKIGRLAI
jgi:hypothetical protein